LTLPFQADGNIAASCLMPAIATANMPSRFYGVRSPQLKVSSTYGGGTPRTTEMLRPATIPANDLRRRQGAALVEMALILPLFLLIVLGIIEFGRAMMVGQIVTNAARHGTRQAVLDGSTNAEIEDEIRQFMQEAVGSDPADVSVTIEVEPYPGNPDPANDLSAALPKDTCRIQVRIPYSEVGYITGRFLQSAQLRGSCSMRHE
jgi:hypothetical protein